MINHKNILFVSPVLGLVVSLVSGLFTFDEVLPELLPVLSVLEVMLASLISNSVLHSPSL